MPASSTLMWAASNAVNTASRFLRVCFEGEAAEAVVPAEFDNHHRWMYLHDRADVRCRVLGCGAAGSTVFDFVFVATLVEIALQRIGIGLAGLESVTGSDAVAVTHDDGPFSTEERNRDADEQEK